MDNFASVEPQGTADLAKAMLMCTERFSDRHEVHGGRNTHFAQLSRELFNSDAWGRAQLESGALRPKESARVGATAPGRVPSASEQSEGASLKSMKAYEE